MNTASQVSVGSRVQVLENGNNVCNSESDSDTEDHGTVIKDGYKGIHTNENGNPTGLQHKMNTEQANTARAASHEASPPPPEPAPERKGTPLNSDDQDSQDMSEDQRRANERAKRMARAPLEKSSIPTESTHMVTRYQERTRAELDACDQGSAQGQTDTRVPQRHASKT
jgi:hypothetical protein